MKHFLVPALLLLAGCNAATFTDDTERDPATQSFVSVEQIPELQKQATKSCLCTRKKSIGGKDGCWSDFWKEANNYRHGTAAAACGPGSVEVVEFDAASNVIPQSDMSVMIEWGYGACSDPELPAKKREYEGETGNEGC